MLDIFIYIIFTEKYAAYVTADRKVYGTHIVKH